MTADILYTGGDIVTVDDEGSIEAGKHADPVILDRNPLTVDPTDIKDISVLETIKEGQIIYSA